MAEFNLMEPVTIVVPRADGPSIGWTGVLLETDNTGVTLEVEGDKIMFFPYTMGYYMVKEKDHG